MLVTNATVVTWGTPHTVINDGGLYFSGDRIIEVGASAELSAKYPDADRLDARGQLLMPGNICAHTHFYGAFARGMSVPGDPPKDFPEILERLWWRLDRALTPEDVRYSALGALVNAVRQGTTTLIDHHASPQCVDGSLDVIAAAVRQSGVRCVLSYEVTDRNGADEARAGIAENMRFIAQCKRQPEALLAASFGLHAGLTLSDGTLAACAGANPHGGFHVHVAEHEADEYHSLQSYQRRVADRLHAFGILGARSIAAHCVHIDIAEALLLRDTQTWVTHQPRSNMNNAVGVADVEGLLRAGVRVALGNDGFSNAMWDEWKTAYLLHKVWHRDPQRAGGNLIVQMAVENNAALAGVFFPQAPLGVLAAGAFADMILVDYHAPTPLTAGNLPWHILFGFDAGMVTTTICGGKVLMRDRALLFLDEAQIAAHSRELATAVWQRV